MKEKIRMKNLDKKKWYAVQLTDIFDTVMRGKRLKKADHISGNIPYVSSTALDNGTDGTCGNNKDVRKFSDCLSLANSGSVGSCFYHPYEFVASDHVTTLKRRDTNKDCYLALAVLVGRLGEKYDFNREINDTRISREKIMLPISDTGEPDYQYMAKYTRRKRNTLLEKYQLHVGKTININYMSEKPLLHLVPLREKKWREFYIGSLFSISRPPARNKDNYPEGAVPFVASGSVNNGVMKFCTPLQEETPDKGNCITVSPVDGSTFYQPSVFLGRGGAGSSVLILRREGLSLYNGLFMANMIRQTCSKYTYGHMGNKDGIKRERVLLPVNDAGEADFAYMEQYVRNMMLRKYKQYLRYLEKNTKGSPS